ncbi:MAG: ATP-binding protein [Brevinematia bacterium]
MDNLERLSALQILIPTVSTGLLAAGVLLFLYIYSLYRERVYLSVLVLGLLGMIFVGSEAMILFIGGQYRNIELGRQFQRIEQLAATFFLFALPFFVSEFLVLTPKLKKVARIISFVGLFIAIAITVIAFALPDLFISFSIHHPKWQISEADYSRGSNGIVYVIRDGLLGLWIIYLLSMIITDLVMHKNLKLLLLPFIGILVGIYSAVVDILFIYTGVNYDFMPHEIFSRFSFGITFFILTAMIALSRKFIMSAKELEETYRKLTISERKYRSLIEGTQDWVFTMDENFIIKSGNRAFLRENNLKDDVFGRLHFIELIYFPEEASLIGLQVIKNEIQKLVNEGKPVSFKCFFKKSDIEGPKEYIVKMENISVDESVEILCKISKIEDDPLLKFFHSEKKKYVLPNNLMVAREMAKRMVINLERYIDKGEAQMLELAIFEMIVNSIEHGNLEISFDEKTIALQNDNYLNFLMERQNLPEYKDKKITIEYSITPEHAAFKIADDGKGFDYKKLILKAADEVGEEIAHGRGISLALSLFDEVRYNDTGNQVLLVKRFR